MTLISDSPYQVVKKPFPLEMKGFHATIFQ